MLEMKTIGKPCAGKPHARFDEEVQSGDKRNSGFTLSYIRGNPRLNLDTDTHGLCTRIKKEICVNLC
jgi:hypothetical protein